MPGLLDWLKGQGVTIPDDITQDPPKADDPPKSDPPADPPKNDDPPADPRLAELETLKATSAAQEAKIAEQDQAIRLLAQRPSGGGNPPAPVDFTKRPQSERFEVYTKAQNGDADARQLVDNLVKTEWAK